MTRNKAIEEAKNEIRPRVGKRVANWIVKDIAPGVVAVTPYSTRLMHPPTVKKEYDI